MAVVAFSAAADSRDSGTEKPAEPHTVLAQASGEGAASAESEASAPAVEGEGAATGEGEGEGEGGGAGDQEQALQRDMSFIEGHMRAGLALYEAGDLAAAKTHMGHPITEKYGAVEAPLAERGFGRLRDQIIAVATATQAEAPFAEVRAAFDAARGPWKRFAQACRQGTKCLVWRH